MPLLRRQVLIVGLALTLGCGASRPRLPPAGPAPSESDPVVVYGAPWCQHTRAAQNWLRARNIPSRLANVDDDPEALVEMRTRALAQGLEARGIPVLSVRGRVLIGFDPASLEAALSD